MVQYKKILLIFTATTEQGPFYKRIFTHKSNSIGNRFAVFRLFRSLQFSTCGCHVMGKYCMIFHWVSSVVSWIPLHYSKGFFYVMASGMNNPTAYWTAWSVESLKNPNLTCPFVTGDLCVWIPLSHNIESISMASMSHHGMMCERIFTFYYCMIFCRYLRILIYSTSFFSGI